MHYISWKSFGFGGLTPSEPPVNNMAWHQQAGVLAPTPPKQTEKVTIVQLNLTTYYHAIFSVVKWLNLILFVFFFLLIKKKTSIKLIPRNITFRAKLKTIVQLNITTYYQAIFIYVKWLNLILFMYFLIKKIKLSITLIPKKYNI